ncbi:hypothetical protein E4O92_20900 [Massilia horti]|uniref:Rap1a immunity protein domain-containing protein n=1 Tax=Massilia horti TaxID=2562153 RepID=A0A4Y9STM1_9BURK|nr:hypothetical protein E4O92_20900 [Massilia horti]
MIFGLLVVVGGYAAGAGKTILFPPQLSSTDFVRQWRGAPGFPADWPPRVQGDKAYAEGYLAAVVDLTQGTKWCSPAQMEPGERDDRVIYAVEKSPTNTNAAKALLDQYVARFPCQ